MEEEFYKKKILYLLKNVTINLEVYSAVLICKLYLIRPILR
jgi:hypothetical protein